MRKFLSGKTFRILACAAILVLGAGSVIDFDVEKGFSRNWLARMFSGYAAFGCGCVILRWKSFLRPLSAILLTFQAIFMCLAAGKPLWGVLAGWAMAIIIWLLNRKLYPFKKNAFVEIMR